MKQATPKHHHHQAGVSPSTIPQILSLIQAKLRLFSTSGGRGSGAGLTSRRTAAVEGMAAVFSEEDI